MLEIRSQRPISQEPQLNTAIRVSFRPPAQRGNEGMETLAFDELATIQQASPTTRSALQCNGPERCGVRRIGCREEPAMRDPKGTHVASSTGAIHEHGIRPREHV